MIYILYSSHCLVFVKYQNIIEHRLSIWGLNDIDTKYIINDVKNESTLFTHVYVLICKILLSGRFFPAFSGTGWLKSERQD